MTRVDFCAELDQAIRTRDARLVRAATCYPHGPLLRFTVARAPAWRTGPPVLDPLGLVWYARTGQWRGLLGWLTTGLLLGLPADEVLDCASGSDRSLDDLTDAAHEGARAWRHALLTVVDETRGGRDGT